MEDKEIMRLLNEMEERLSVKIDKFMDCLSKDTERIKGVENGIQSNTERIGNLDKKFVDYAVTHDNFHAKAINKWRWAVIASCTAVTAMCGIVVLVLKIKGVV